MSSTFREIRAIFWAQVSNPRVLGTFAALLIMFTFIGPFGTFQSLPLPIRFAYWATTMVGCWLISLALIAIFLGLLLPYVNRPLVLVALAMLSSIVPCAMLVVFAIDVFLQPPEPIGLNWELLSFVVAIGLASGVIVVLVQRNEEVEEKSDPLDNALMMRLQPGHRGPVKHMSMQDHYISVVTVRGTELVLMRMADAVAALDPVQGLQVHRSYWVGREYVSHTKREKGQPVLVMTDGTEIPVSRSYVKAVREAGLI